MLGAAIIVFRETLEAALFVGIIAAATRGLVGRGRWLTAGCAVGLSGALLLAAGAERISNWADGMGHDLMNVAILATALVMLGWHRIWVANQGAQMAAEAKALGHSYKTGEKTPWALLVVVALSVLREGAETVLFVTGYVTGAGAAGAVTGVVLGLLSGVAVGLLIYFGLSRIPLRHMFALTNALILMLAAAMASQLARALSQAGLLDLWTDPLWDSSHWLSMSSPLGTLAHALVGYDAQPSGLQLAFYLSALLMIGLAARQVRRSMRSPGR